MRLTHCADSLTPMRRFDAQESSEYETDSEEEEETYGRRLIKPVFVPKEDRDVRPS